MTIWLTIHDPPPVGVHTSGHHYIYVQRQHSSQIDFVCIGDRVYIYETKKSAVIDDKCGPVQLEPGRKGIISLAIVSNGFIRYSKSDIWNGKEYVGYFETETLMEALIPLSELRHIWFQHGLREFNPRVRSGLRKLRGLEIYILGTHPTFQI